MCGASGRRVGVSTQFYLILGNGKIGAVLHSIKASQFLNPPSSPAHSHSEAVKLDVWKRIYARLGPYWKGVMVSLILLSIEAATQQTLAVTMKPLLDAGFSGAEPSYMWSIPRAVIVPMQIERDALGERMCTYVEI